MSEGESVLHAERAAHVLLRELVIPGSSLVAEAYIDLVEQLRKETPDAKLS